MPTKRYTARAYADQHMPADAWKPVVSAMIYRTAQTRLRVTVEQNASHQALGLIDIEDHEGSDRQFTDDLTPVLDHLSPHDECLLAERLVQRLIAWETEDIPKGPSGVGRAPVASDLLSRLSQQLATAKAKEAKVVAT